MLERHLLLWLCLLGLGAFYWDPIAETLGVPAVSDVEAVAQPGAEGAPPAQASGDARPVSRWDPFKTIAPYLSVVFAVTMFAIGWMLPRDEIVQIVKRWPSVLAGTAVQYVSMPLLAYVIGRLYRLDDDAMLGIVLVGCVPGAMASNVLTLVARGNVSYSLCLTTTATALSPLLVPSLIWLTVARRVEVPLLQASWFLCWTVVLPVIAGHLAGRYCGRWETAARKVGTVVANLAILCIITVVVGLQRDKLRDLVLVVFLALLTLNLLGYLAGYLGGSLLRLPAGMRRALTLEVGMQNAGLGTVMATAFFADRPAAAIVPALYTFGCMATGTLLAHLWASRSRQPGGI